MNHEGIPSAEQLTLQEKILYTGVFVLEAIKRYGLCTLHFQPIDTQHHQMAIAIQQLESHANDRGQFGY